MARFTGKISQRALNDLVEQDLVEHCIIDLRTAQAVPIPISPAFANVTASISLDQLASTLKDSSSWKAAFPDGPPYPSASHLLIFDTPSEEVFLQAAACAATHNFQRCLHLQSPAADAPAAGVTFVNRDACAYLLHLQQQCAAPLDFMFVDLRRHDERSMYGHIAGSIHIPVETFIFALQQDAQAFESTCHVRKPAKDELVILQCRSDRRAAWAAMLAREQGFSRVLVYKQGSYGWRLDPAVKAYSSYKLSDDPPDVEDFPLEVVDGDAAITELENLGILAPLT